MILQFTDEEFKKISPNINDAVTQVDCSIYTKCCDNPSFINQMGSSYCLCKNCNKKCYKCKGQ